MCIRDRFRAAHFGLVNSVAIFVKCMDEILGHNTCLLYTSSNPANGKLRCLLIPRKRDRWSEMWRQYYVREICAPEPDSQTEVFIWKSWKDCNMICRKHVPIYGKQVTGSSVMTTHLPTQCWVLNSFDEKWHEALASSSVFTQSCPVSFS